MLTPTEYERIHLDMSNTKNTAANTTRYINDNGIDGSARRVFAVVTEWTSADGRKRVEIEKFDTRAEADSWLKWA